MFRFFAVFVFVLSTSALGTYNGIDFYTGEPKAGAGCTIEGGGTYFLEDDCLPNLTITLRAVANGGGESVGSCGTYARLSGNWGEAEGSSNPCSVTVPGSGTYTVYAKLIDEFGYVFESEETDVTVTCP